MNINFNYAHLEFIYNLLIDHYMFICNGLLISVLSVGSFIFFSGRTGKIIDATQKIVTTIAAGSITYKNYKDNSSSSSDNDEDKKDKKDSNSNKTDDNKSDSDSSNNK